MTIIPPVHRTIVVPWMPEAAFRRFTAEIMSWWPHQTHSVGEKKLKMILVGSVVQRVQRMRALAGDPRDRAQGELRA